MIREQLDISERNFTQERQQFQEMRQQVIPVHDKCCFREKLLETPYTYLSIHIACNGQCYALIDSVMLSFSAHIDQENMPESHVVPTPLALL